MMNPQSKAQSQPTSQARRDAEANRRMLELASLLMHSQCPSVIVPVARALKAVL